MRYGNESPLLYGHCIWPVVFKEMDDDLWEIIKPHLPPQKAKTGRLKADLRKSFNGILKTGITWVDDPSADSF